MTTQVNVCAVNLPCMVCIFSLSLGKSLCLICLLTTLLLMVIMSTVLLWRASWGKEPNEIPQPPLTEEPICELYNCCNLCTYASICTPVTSDWECRWVMTASKSEEESRSTSWFVPAASYVCARTQSLIGGDYMYTDVFRALKYNY